MRFEDTIISRKDLFSIGFDRETGQHYVSFPVSNGMVEYEEYYFLDKDLYDSSISCFDKLIEFVSKCKDRKMDDRLIVQPGTNRGLAVDWP